MSTKIVQVKPLTLDSNIGTSNTTAIVSGMVGLDGVDLTQTDFGSIIYGTFEPNTAREEAVSFTITSCVDGVANIDFGVSGRGLIGKSPYGTGGITYAHSAGVKLVISNNPNLFNKFTAKDNDETVTGAWSFPTTPAGGNNPATKTYTDTVGATKVGLTGNETVAGIKTFSSSPIVPTPTTDMQASTKKYVDDTAVALTGDETIAGVKTFSSSPIVPDATTAQQPLTKGQFDSAVAAAASDASPTVQGTAKIDTAADDPLNPVALTATTNRIAALAGGGNLGTPSGSNKFLTEAYNASASGVPIVRVYTSSATWSKPTGLKYVTVEGVGGGCGGEGDEGTGGGAGGYFRKLILAASLGATETVTIGAGTGGTASATPTTAGNTTFGAHATGNGGAATTGGTATGGDLNITGGVGSKASSGTGGNWSQGGSSYLGIGAGNSGQGGTGYGAGGAGGRQCLAAAPAGAGVVAERAEDPPDPQDPA